MRSGSLMVSSGSEIHGIITERDVLDKLPFEVGASRKIKVRPVAQMPLAVRLPAHERRATLLGRCLS
eukprot:scaffold53608_cov30-Tisochrysis_lutea.AAC.2